ncbi:MAG: DUF1992 domain-containing protein [Gammaproteobacteria bacterium]|jgi:hypothetical protein
MWLIDKIAEQRITEAGRKGAFDNLPGAGKPVHVDDDSQIPDSLRVGYRLLKNAGYLPAELQLRKEVVSVQQLLATLDPQDNAAVKAAQKRLNFLLSKMNMNNNGSVAMEEAYYEKLKCMLNQRAPKSTP